MSSRQDLHHQVWLKRLSLKRFKGLWGIYLHALLRMLGMSLVGIFIPIYIYKLTGTFASIFAFYFLYHFTVILTSALAGEAINRFGLDKVAISGAILKTIFLTLLILSGNNLGLLWLTAVIWGLSVSTTWLPYHYTVVAEEDGDGKFGHEVSYLQIVDKLGSALAPFLGGLLIFFFNFSVLYGVGIILVAFSVVPLLLDSFDKRGMDYRVKRVWQGLLQERFRPIGVGLIGYVLENRIFGILRPLFIFLTLTSVTKLGAIESVAILSTVIVVWWAGKWVDSKGFGLMKIGIFANALVWLLLPFLSSAASFFIHSTAYLLIAVLIWTPFDSAIYELASRQRKLEFFVRREIVVHTIGSLFFALMFILFGIQPNWFVVFGLGSISLFLCLAVLKGVKDGAARQRLEIHQTALR